MVWLCLISMKILDVIPEEVFRYICLETSSKILSRVYIKLFSSFNVFLKLIMDPQRYQDPAFNRYVEM